MCFIWQNLLYDLLSVHNVWSQGCWGERSDASNFPPYIRGYKNVHHKESDNCEQIFLDQFLWL